MCVFVGLYCSEPEFVASFSVPDSFSDDDDKVYFFFREWAAVEEGAGPWDRKLYARVARVCKVGGVHPLSDRKLKASNWHESNTNKNRASISTQTDTNTYNDTNTDTKANTNPGADTVSQETA